MDGTETGRYASCHVPDIGSPSHQELKNGKTRKVPLERGLADKLIAWREKNPTSVLVFPTENGKVEGHFLRI
ncbi:MAG: hypothetical protein WCA20_06740 [Candidatus Sulfotelmatobacter sp.]